MRTSFVQLILMFLCCIFWFCSGDGAAAEGTDTTLAAPVFDLKVGNRGSEISQIINEMSQGLSLDQEGSTTNDVNDELIALITND